MIARPDTAAVREGLKDFQRETVDYVFDRLYGSDATRRFLVADEVGLGKTMVARGVIARTIDHLWDSVLCKERPCTSRTQANPLAQILCLAGGQAQGALVRESCWRPDRLQSCVPIEDRYVVMLDISLRRATTMPLKLQVVSIEASAIL